jgi:hypothetical protein
MPITANQISIPDGYRRLPYKTIAGFAWAADLTVQPRYLGMVWKIQIFPHNRFCNF